jgi:hypothetical protein
MYAFHCLIVLSIFVLGSLKPASANPESGNPPPCTPPPAPSNVTPVSAMNICSGQFTILIGSGTGTLTWHSAATGGTLLGTGTFFFTPVLTSGVTYFMQDSTCAASLTRTPVTINVGTTPSLTLSSSSSTICFGSAVTLGCSGASTYLWNPGGLTGSSVNVTPATTTTYTVTGTSSTGCTATATRTINVNPVPVVSTTASSTSICQGSTVTISATGANGYLWQPGSISGPNITVSPSATTTYTVIGQSTTTFCTNTTTRTITVNPLPTTSATATPSAICLGGSTTLQASGAATYIWQPGNQSGANITVSPSTTTTYTVTGTNASGCTKTATAVVTVNPPCIAELNLNVLIEGYTNNLGVMEPVLLNQGIASATATQTDSIRVELRASTAPYAMVSAFTGIVQTNGNIVCTFPVAGNYYIVIKHRNAIETWSANPVTLSFNTPQNYNFTTAAAQAYGANQKMVSTGVYALYSGELNADENIDVIDLALVEDGIAAFGSGYLNTDINGDGNVDILDLPVVEDNINGFIFSSHP